MKTEKTEKTLAEIQALVKAPKGQYNSYGKYKYRSAEDIVEAVKVVINPLGYYLVITDEVVLLGNRFYIKATATLSDGTNTYTVSAFAREEESKKGMDGAQITGASSSYARKYALNGLFAIDDTKDADATNNHSDEWAESIQGCKTQSELVELYQQNKDQVESDPRLKKLFAEQKTKVK